MQTFPYVGKDSLAGRYGWMPAVSAHVTEHRGFFALPVNHVIGESMTRPHP